MAAQLAAAPRSVPHDKYKVLSATSECTTNVRYPGYATPEADEVPRTYIIPTMFAKVACDVLKLEEASAEAERERTAEQAGNCR